jgi:hypothetical protein
MTLKKRIAKLEERAGPVWRRPCDIVCLDLDGLILWDGTEAMLEWSGRPLTDWPREWLEQPWPLKLLVGVDPLLMLGSDLRGLKQPFDARFEEDEDGGTSPRQPAPNSPRLYNTILE